MDLDLHIAHLERAATEDRAELIQRIAAIAWIEGLRVGIDLIQTDPYPINPYGAKP